MKEALAVFTIAQNERTWLPVWVNYYRSQVPPRHLYILDHDSTGEGLAVLEGLRARFGVNVVPVHRRASFDHGWLRDTVCRFQQFLLGSYRAVLFAEVDEIVSVTPRGRFAVFGPATRCTSLQDYAGAALTEKRKFVRCTGYEVVHRPDEEEAPIDWSRPLLEQRRWWYRSARYSKTLLSSIPLLWEEGFHRASNVPSRTPVERRLVLIHLHKLDFEFCLERHRETAARNWSESDRRAGAGWQNRVTDREELMRWFTRSIDRRDEEARLVRIPERIRSIV